MTTTTSLAMTKASEKRASGPCARVCERTAKSAEGLAVNDGMALVSFEGNHRILAFDVGKCGAAARGAPIVFGDYGLSLNDAYEEARIAVDAGNGSEPLAVTPDWYVFAGIERKVGHLNSLSARPIEAEPEFDLRVGVDAPEFAGMDVIPGAGGNGAVRAFLIHRSPAADGAVWITETDLLRFEPRVDEQRPSRGEMETLNCAVGDSPRHEVTATPSSTVKAMPACTAWPDISTACSRPTAGIAPFRISW